MNMHFLFIVYHLLPITTAHAATNITALFAFGDSILDPGNNNNLFTIFRSNHRPYGLEFPNHVPTGRFSNGKLATDFLVSNLGLKQLLPPYLSPSLATRDLLTGVSFASAGSGLDSSTSSGANVLSLDDQLAYFDKALTRINRLVGFEETNRVLESAVFVIGVGSNDMLYNVYGLGIERKLLHGDDQVSEYQGLLLRNLEGFVRRLHTMGARRIAVMGLPPMGCLPIQVTIESITTMFKRVCVKQPNVHSQSYNMKLRSLTLRMQETLVPESRVAYVDIYTPMMDMIRRPAMYGFEKTLVGCCGMGSIEMGPLCNEFSPTCPNPSKYVFFDAAHPTQAAYKYLAQHFKKNVLPSFMA